MSGTGIGAKSGQPDRRAGETAHLDFYPGRGSRDHRNLSDRDGDAAWLPPRLGPSSMPRVCREELMQRSGPAKPCSATWPTRYFVRSFGLARRQSHCARRFRPASSSTHWFRASRARCSSRGTPTTWRACTSTSHRPRAPWRNAWSGRRDNRGHRSLWDGGPPGPRRHHAQGPGLHMLLVLSNSVRMPLDAKWTGSPRYRLEELREGRAVQVAGYVEMFGNAHPGATAAFSPNPTGTNSSRYSRPLAA